MYIKYWQKTGEKMKKSSSSDLRPSPFNYTFAWETKQAT